MEQWFFAQRPVTRCEICATLIGGDDIWDCDRCGRAVCRRHAVNYAPGESVVRDVACSECDETGIADGWFY